jgi:GNAT superfamily N-acetyltransferase
MSLVIRPLDESDLEAADRIFRLAFGRFVGHPDPSQMFGDRDMIRTRWREAPEAAIGAYLDGVLVGSNFAAGWGSVGFFGPLTIHPDHWGQGIASPLIRAALDLFSAWGTEDVGLFTFPQSPMHVGLYQKFGFWPRFLTVVLSKPAAPTSPPQGCALDPEDGTVPDEDLRDLCGAIHPGLDVGREVVAVRRQGLGQVVTLREDGALVGLAVCHLGPGTEAGGDSCYVKFGGVRPGPDAGPRFDRLLASCEWLAASRGIGRLALGINTACHDAYLRALARGFRNEFHGVAMHRDDRPGFCRPDAHVIADWR